MRNVGIGLHVALETSKKILSSFLRAMEKPLESVHWGCDMTRSVFSKRTSRIEEGGAKEGHMHVGSHSELVQFSTQRAG